MVAKFARRALLSACLPLSVCIGPGVAPSQIPNQLPNAASRLAVEFPDPNGCPQEFTLTSPVSIGLFPASNLRHLPNPDANTRQPSALRLELKTSGDTVSIVAMVLYGDFDVAKATGSVEDIPHEILARHSGSLGEEVVFPELQVVGLEPITFRIVAPQLVAPNHPALRSNAPSVSLDNFASRDRITGTVTVHNLSAKSVVAYRVGSSPDGESGWSEETMPRLAPGATDQLTVSNGFEPVASGTCPDAPQNPTIILQAALFDDGSYEGDMKIAAQLAAHRMGCDLQRQRIRSLAEAILANPDLDVGATIERIRTAVNQLSVEPDADSIPRLQAQFPDFPESAYAGLALEVSHQMKLEKESLDSELQRYQTDATTRTTPASFARWLAMNSKD